MNLTEKEALIFIYKSNINMHEKRINKLYAEIEKIKDQINDEKRNLKENEKFLAKILDK